MRRSADSEIRHCTLRIGEADIQRLLSIGVARSSRLDYEQGTCVDAADDRSGTCGHAQLRQPTDRRPS